MVPPACETRGPSAWAAISRETPPPRPPRLATKLAMEDMTVVTSSVSSPSVPDEDCLEVDELLEGIDRVRIDDLWTTPRGANVTRNPIFRPGLFAPPGDGLGVVNLVEEEFPRMFKVYPCRNREACLMKGEVGECFGYHDMAVDRRRANVSMYKPHMCRFVEEAGGCRKGDRCPFSHNDFERRYHPDRFGKETCRDFLRGDCPRRYCTFRHEVSGKVEIALHQMEMMNDKEVLQLVLKIAEPRGRALCEKLLRRFGHGKKHSGWRLEGFNPHGRDDQKVKFVAARVEEVKRRLRTAGEKKWASSLKTSSLRDMMSGVRKVAEEIRERCRSDENYVEGGSEVHRLIRAVFSNTNWSCHSQEGDNPFLVTPENQNDALTALEKLVDVMLTKGPGGENVNRVNELGRGEVGRGEVPRLWAVPSTIGGV